MMAGLPLTSDVHVARVFASWINHVSARDISSAEYAVRGVNFRVLDEACDVIRNIRPEEFTTAVGELAKRHKIPDSVRDQTLFNRHPKKPVIQEFHFNKSLDETFVCGRIAMVNQQSSCVDVAYSVCRMRYTLSPTLFDCEKKAKIIGFITGTELWQDEEEISFYFRHRLVEKFVKKFSYLLI